MTHKVSLPHSVTSARGVWRPLLSRMPFEKSGLYAVIISDGVLQLELRLYVRFLIGGIASDCVEDDYPTDMDGYVTPPLRMLGIAPLLPPHYRRILLSHISHRFTPQSLKKLTKNLATPISPSTIYHASLKSI